MEKSDDIAAPVVEQVRQALYQVAVQAAVDEIDRIPAQFTDVPNLIYRLDSESETGQILIFGSFLEDKILTLLKLQMKHLDSKAAEEQLFGSNGPLSTMSSRILLAYQLGWLHKSQMDALSAFRKIRNAFAHSAFKITMADQNIRDLFGAIGPDVEEMVETSKDALSVYANPALKEFDDVPARTANLARLAVMAFRTFEDLMVLPYARAYNVHPMSISAFDVSKKVKEIRYEMSRTIIMIFATPELEAKFAEMNAANALVRDIGNGA